MKINADIYLDESELHYTFIRAPGPGGQNVNKVASAVLLRFNVLHATLPEAVKARLLTLNSSKISSRGDLLIKASRHRTQLLNKADALSRLKKIIEKAATLPKKRKATKLSRAVKAKRVDTKKRRGLTKARRQEKIISQD